ncbi:IS110 family transposase [Flavivirga amylovorans]|uniref:IS110 family transposase n=1 Tax=Flavivirga amylovorans TaxID=870486 RepID=A0ABT8X2A1_9FLAO|nr:IS110 family transposase [Flavivirga amylovorans]MDO5988082.1 IS110 family transposase [Flavivirga amylovorans]
MKIKETVGIDISKLTLDVRIHSSQVFDVFENTLKGYGKMLKWVRKNTRYLNSETIFVFEHTGLYSYGLSVFLSKHNIPFAVVSGLEIKKSLGIVRGKNDKIDATKIALYAYRLRDEITLFQMPTNAINKLKRLLSLRERMVKHRAGYKNSLGEYQRLFCRVENRSFFQSHKKLIRYLSIEIKSIEDQMKEIIDSSSKLKAHYSLITSIRGIGPQTALFLIVYTNGFTKFKNARKFASYCGIAPFPYSSGTSIRRRTRVSHYANKKIKSLLDMCAKTAIQYNIEMKLYYEQKVEEGKNRRSTINVIRNKLLARVFAVVQRGTPYIDIKKYAA